MAEPSVKISGSEIHPSFSPDYSSNDPTSWTQCLALLKASKVTLVDTSFVVFESLFSASMITIFTNTVDCYNINKIVWF